jgi:hypothetical protein
MILAHGSGMDDAAFIILPLLVLAAVRLINRRRPHIPGGSHDSQQSHE